MICAITGSVLKCMARSCQCGSDVCGLEKDVRSVAIYDICKEMTSCNRFEGVARHSATIWTSHCLPLSSSRGIYALIPELVFVEMQCLRSPIG